MLLALHAQQVERFGGAHGVIDENVVLSALGRPVNRWAYDESADLADLAASYLVGFARSQGFRDGNKRTGLSTALVFLGLNGVTLDVPPGELYALTMAVATNQGDDATAASYFRSRLP
jgi:death on curing protein